MTTLVFTSAPTEFCYCQAGLAYNKFPPPKRLSFPLSQNELLSDVRDTQCSSVRRYEGENENLET